LRQSAQTFSRLFEFAIGSDFEPAVDLNFPHRLQENAQLSGAGMFNVR